MPTYQYQCKACGHQLEEFQSITEPHLTRCPQCGVDSLVRVIGAGAGFIFKGSGFYLTDYKKETKPAPATEKKSENPSTPTPKKDPT